jgi:periplasmic copper chaperone A
VRIDFRYITAWLLLGVLPLPVSAADLQVTALQVTGVWARPTPPGAKVGAVYFAISNRGVKEDVLLGVSSEVAASVQIHESRLVQGVMQMREVASVACPAGATVKVEPGGLHVMLLGLKQPLTAGMRFDLSLRFRDAGSLLIRVAVQNGS